MKTRTYRLVNAKTVFVISLLVIALTILGIYFWGLGKHHTFFYNSLASTTILSAAFFFFITAGLYQGIKLKDNLGKVTDKMRLPDSLDLSAAGDAGPLLEAADDVPGIMAGVLLWIVWGVVFAAVLWIFGNVVLLVVAAFVGMLYWIFFRALRLVFRNAKRCKGKFWESVRVGFAYTCLYNVWIYGIFMLAEYLKK
ncbi:MAG: hypothetical protein AVDCRST_MAG56-896 [uncultured Cytophagales bacterium]|uniref:Uncharacterized protein n=1 Tax=uncultured Cytophagales bacterium TaxID=158755 RepID=A0A6J4HP66_9SPHI|nr:MAG: hypothetical protein AVDCRST_MAG56-896 [uncultured Cytophagales bacterium]